MNIEINSDEIITLMKQSHSDDISNTLDQIIRYCRHVQKDYIEGNSEISGIHILTELLKQGSIKPDLCLNQKLPDGASTNPSHTLLPIAHKNQPLTVCGLQKCGTTKNKFSI